MNTIENILEKLVAYRSYVPYENDAFEYLLPFLKERGFTVKTQRVSQKRYNLLAERGKSDRSILIYIHLDTVSPNSSRNSFLSLQKTDDHLEGLGVFDMKGGIAVILSLLDEVSLKNHSLKLVFGIDEEGNSEGVFSLVSSSFIDNVVFALCPEACIVPREWKLPIMMTIGGRGRCAFDVIIPGKTRHGAEESGGINAIEQAAIFIQHLKNWQNAHNTYMGDSSFFVRSIHAGNEALSLPDCVIVSIDYQLVSPQNPDGVLVDLRRFVHNLYEKNILNISLRELVSIKLQARRTPYISPYKVDLNNEYVKKIDSLIEKRYGFIQHDYAKSVADQNVIYESGIPIVTLGPLGGNVHQAGEWVSSKSLLELREIYKELLSQF